MFAYAWIILISPLLGFAALSFFGNRIPRNLIGPAGCASVGLAFAATLLALHDLTFLEPDQRLGNVHILYPWIVSGSFKLNVSILIDPLSVFMLLVVTGVGFLIHVYSIDYMAKDPRLSVFFAYMNLFVFSMCLLVMAADFFFLIVGWALVGLASYLLIGFWSERTSAVLAARKAFIMNVIGDVGMIVAAFIMFESFGSLNYAEVFSAASDTLLPNDDVAILVTLLLLVGAFAKSAQIPLHTWLPDAMEGPTPVSALIHAATMVTAGVYLVARCHVLFDLAPYTLFLVAAVGILTAVFAGSMGMVQHDIKRIIAYSTMSQLGYMFLAAGIGAYSVAMFHLMTHAFFKALLFLGAGSVIHALNDEQDIRKMGGLRFVMPVTFYTFLIGALALSSFPLTSGFFSKEQILINAWYADGSNIVFWAIGIFTAGMTGFYAFRLFFYTFHGDLKSPDAHPHEAPQMMVGVLVVLAFFSLFIGFAAPLVHGFLAPVFGGQAPPHYENHILEGIAIAAGIGGILTAGALYLTGSDKLEFAKQIFAPFYDLLYRKYYVDEIYDFLIVRPMRATAAFFWRKGEVEGIDYVVDQVGAGVRETSYGISLWQSGKVRFYALNMLAGAVLILLFVVFL